MYVYTTYYMQYKNIYYIVKKIIYCFIFPNWHKKLSNFKWFQRIIYEDFPGGSVVKTLNFHFRGSGSIPGQGINIPRAL